MLIYNGLCDLTIGKRPLHWQWLMTVETSGIVSLYLDPGHNATSSLVEVGKEWFWRADLKNVSWLKLGFHLLAWTQPFTFKSSDQLLWEFGFCSAIDGVHFLGFM